MKWFTDLFERKIRLTAERFEHIDSDHPEMTGQIDRIAETLSQPSAVIRSRTDSAVELFYRHCLVTPVSEKYMCVVVKVNGSDIFIITAYFTDTFKRGDVLWEQK
jgi:hypothetical protein